MLMKFIVLNVDTGKEKFEYFYQYSVFFDIIFEGNNFVISEENPAIVDYLIENSNDIVDNSGSNIAIGYNSPTFELTLDTLNEDSLEFSYKGISVSIQEMNVRPPYIDVIYETRDLKSKAKLNINTGVIYDIVDFNEAYSDDVAQSISLNESFYSNPEDMFILSKNEDGELSLFSDDLKEIHSYFNLKD